MNILDLLRPRPKAPAEAGELPDELLASLEAAHVLLRPHDEGGAPRAVVQLPGGLGGWIHGAGEDERHIRRLFPGLTDEQLARAHRYLSAQVQRRVRAMAAGAEKGQRRTFANAWSREAW